MFREAGDSMRIGLAKLMAIIATCCVLGGSAITASASYNSVYPTPGKWHGNSSDRPAPGKPKFKLSFKVSNDTNHVSAFHLRFNYHCDNDGDGWIDADLSKKASVNHATGHFGFIKHFKVPGLTKDAYVNFDGYFAEAGTVAKRAAGSIAAGYFYDTNGDFCVGHDQSFKAQHK